MKAVAVALVLIAGAAVVLWYGNTLNSWVLGGLIGGLAALLLSIPISLSLFSYLSRRHDEQTRAEEALLEEEALLSLQEEELRLGRREDRYIEGSVHELYEDESEAYELERLRRQHLAARKRLLEGERRRLVNTEQQETPHLPRERVKALPAPRTKDLSDHRDTDRTLPTRGHYPGMPGATNTTTSLSRGKQQSEALRTARLEALQQGDEEEYQTPQRRYGAAKNRREEGAVDEGGKRAIRTKYLADQSVSRRGEDRSSEQNDAERPTRQRRGRELDTGYTSSHYVETEPIQPQETRPRQATRQPHIESGYLGEEEDPGKSLHTKPLIRRAPYLYDDDPLRQKLSQHLERPSIKRSSRNERNEDLAEEEF